MKRISAISVLALLIGLSWAALLASAGGPVLGKVGVYDPVVHVGKSKIIALNTKDTANGINLP